MQYQLVTNSVDTDQVEERVIDGDRHLVAKDVTFIRPMQLAGGYVPADHVAASADEWAGKPLTVNHPRDDSGCVVSANTEIGKQITVGQALDPTRNADDSVDADLAVNADRAAELGGEAEDIVAALENGEPLNVSSQYFATPLAPGVYDGQHRANVEGNLTPDSIALLPNKKGRCTLPDCGFDPSGVTANTEDTTLRVPVRANSDGEDADADSAPQTGDGASVLETIRSLVNRASGDQGTDTSDERAESRVGPSSQSQTANGSDMDRENLIKEITANSNITRDALDDACDDRVQKLHRDVVANADPDDDDDDDNGGAGVDDGDLPDDVVTTDDLDQFRESLIDDIRSEREQASKRDRAEKIAANSADYDQDDVESLADRLDEELDRKEQEVAAGSGLPGHTGTADRVTANTQTDDDADAYGTGVLD